MKHLNLDMLCHISVNEHIRETDFKYTVEKTSNFYSFIFGIAKIEKAYYKSHYSLYYADNKKFKDWLTNNNYNIDPVDNEIYFNPHIILSFPDKQHTIWFNSIEALNCELYEIRRKIKNPYIIKD